MKALIWFVFLLLAAFWTGLAALSVQLTDWMLAAVASGQVADVAALAGQWPVPAWLTPWLDLSWVQGLQTAWTGMVHWLGQVMPSAASLMVWIGPLVWAVWGLGMLLLLALAGGLHWLAGRAQVSAA